MSSIEKYGISFSPDSFEDEAKVERYMIRNGGYYYENGQRFGEGLIHHFNEYWKLLWPDDYQTWWTDLMVKEILANQFVSVVGPASSWKSSTVARLALMDWSCYPDCTTVLVSSDTLQGLKRRIYADIVKQWQSAHEIYDWFPGHPLDYLCALTYDDIQEEGIRDIRSGFIGIPCRTSTGRFQGLTKYVGTKNRRVWCIGDEFSFMEIGILDAQRNLISNGGNLQHGFVDNPADKEYGKPKRGYKCVFIANPNPSQPGNPSEMVSEPQGGWGSYADDGKTKVWTAKKLPNHPIQCRVICLDSLDSPNSAYPITEPRWESLAGPHKLIAYTEGSESYYSQGRGIFKFGLATFKIITREICEAHHASDEVIWDNDGTTKVAGLDAAYGAGDRCCLGWAEFGRCLDGKTRVLFHPHVLVPIKASSVMTPEDQIAMFCKERLEEWEVPPENLFFDGRGSLAMSISRHCSTKSVAIEFGGVPTERPVGPDIKTKDKLGYTRQKTSREHYANFVSELWWSFRYAVESDQIRGLSHEIIADGAPREWKKVAGGKIQVEVKKDMRKRTGMSPDLFDMAVTTLEGCRQRGFSIAKLGEEPKNGKSKSDWLRKITDSYQKLVASRQPFPQFQK